MSWKVIATRRCGCEIIELDGDVSERATGPCAYHLCRLCGDVPLADSEPDALCEGCYQARRAS